MTINYIHAGVFVPNLGDGDPRNSFGASHDVNLRLEYRDKRAYASELVVHIPPPEDSVNPGTEMQRGEQSQKGSSDKPTTSNSKETNGTSEGNTKKRKATKPASDKFAFWNRKTAELHGSDKHPQDDSASHQSSQTDGHDQTPASKRQRLDSEEKKAVSSSYVDAATSICYLCQTKLKPELVVRHEKESKLHLANLKDTQKCDGAVAKLGYDPRQANSANTGHEAEDTQQENGTLYKDRAAERRAQFSQPKNPSSQPSKPFKGFSMTQKESENDPKPEESTPKASKATAMLAAMGYDASSGKGLGAEGTGITDASFETRLR